MPKTLDLLLGIATVMLLLSLVVTALTHYMVSLCNLRGRHLRAGLVPLLARLDPRIGSRNAVPLATAILKDPLICESAGRMASVIHRAQLIRFCLSLAAEAAGNTSAGSGRQDDPQSYASPVEALYWTLHAHGIADPRAILDRVSRHALELEQVQPELTELARQEMAVVAAVAAPFVAKINACFDQTMDRVSARFTSAVRAITVAAALGLASFLQIDCLALVNHLAMDEGLRNQVVKAALEGKGGESARQQLGVALQLELIRIPASWREWRREWSESGGGGCPLGPHAGGILLTAMLLSLGAPFWYNLLGGALRLRPVLSARDDHERHARRVAKSAPVIPFPSTSLLVSSARLPESGEWLPARESRCSAGRR
ncbi:MAG: hypothetical protein ACLQU1_34795 [Bryobacteraceae bacterium]